MPLRAIGNADGTLISVLAVVVGQGPDELDLVLRGAGGNPSGRSVLLQDGQHPSQLFRVVRA